MKYSKRNKTKFITQVLLVAWMALGLSSCGEESFSTKSKSDGLVTNTITTNSTSSCASFTLVKPKVDFLFLWDNSTSTTFINDDTKSALAHVVENISDRFDYHIMLSPLVIGPGKPTNYQSKLIASSTDGLSGSAISMMIPSSSASSALNSFDPASGSLESGVSRAIDLIKKNAQLPASAGGGEGIFRGGSYLYIVVMSNQDDNSWSEGQSQVAGTEREAYVDEQVKKLLCIRGNYLPSGSTCTGVNLNSTQLRFMNITSFTSDSSSCIGVSSVKKGETYQAVSSAIYSTPYRIWTDGNGNGQLDQSSEITGSDFNRHVDQDDSSKPDSYNICNRTNFSSIFDGINSSINQAIIAHKYDYWPVATSGAAAIDPAEIEVLKNGSAISKLTEPVTSPSANGFTFTNSVQTVNTRYEPTSGESFTGYVVKLYGNARVTYPECIQVKTQTPKEYFGYINMSSKPVESSIAVRINGAEIPQSTTNGWELIKSNGAAQYFTTKNIKIKSPTDYTEATPAVNKSGYMLKLYGSAIYSNGAAVEVFYDPAAN